MSLTRHFRLARLSGMWIVSEYPGDVGSFAQPKQPNAFALY
jgi:hypothetical protein